MMLSLARKTNTQKLGCFLLAVSQIFWAAGCQSESSPRAKRGSTAAGATAGVNVGLILYNTVHHGYETKGETAKMAALENRKSDFIASVNRILPSEVSGNLFPTLVKLLPLIDDGTLEAAVADADGVIQDLLVDRPALEGLAKLLSASPTGASSSRDTRATSLLISRLLAYPELDQVAQALIQLVENNDGVDENGLPNGERNLLRALQGAASRLLQNYQPAPGTQTQLTQTLEELVEALLSPQPLRAFPNLGAPAYAVRLDVNGNPKVLADPATGALPAPFVDGDGDGVADVNAAGKPVDVAGAVIDLPAFGTDGFRDAEGRAVASGGALYYEYFDAKRTLLSELFLLGGGLVEKDVLGKTVFVLDGLSNRVHHDNGTVDPSDDYFTLGPDSPFLDLTHAQFELVKRTPLPELLEGLAEVVKNDPQAFGEMVDKLLVSVKTASSAASTVPKTPGAGQALLDDLLPLLEDTLRPSGRNTSALRALLQAFNSEQRRLRNLPVSFANMMYWHDYRNRIPADANNKSVMHRILDMMVEANKCSAPFMGNMAEFYLKVMAGEERILGIPVTIGTVHFLLDIGFLRRLLCSGIKAADVRALKDFNDTGALEAMKPIAKVFVQRGETTLLKDIMLGLQKHYETVLRPDEPTVVAILSSGSVEKLFEVLDDMTRVRVPSTGQTVTDTLADTLQALLTGGQVTDRRGVVHDNLAKLLAEPLKTLDQRATQRAVKPYLDGLFEDLGETVLATYVDDNGTPGDATDDVERWKWQGLKGSLGKLLEGAADAIPAAGAARTQWADDQQQHMVDLLTGRDLVLIIDVLKTVVTSPQKPVMKKALLGILKPQANPADDVYGALLTLIADGLAHKPHTAQAVDAQALADVLHFVGRELDPNLNKMDGIIKLIRGIIRADDGLLILRVARNAFDKGPNGVDPSAIEVLQDVFDDISAAGGPPAPVTVGEVEDMLDKARHFLTDPEQLPRIIARIKSRSGG